MEENSFEKFLVGFNDTTGSANELVLTLPSIKEEQKKDSMECMEILDSP